MKMEQWIRLFAGSFVLVSLALAHWVNPNWLCLPPLWARTFSSRRSRAGASWRRSSPGSASQPTRSHRREAKAAKGLRSFSAVSAPPRWNTLSAFTSGRSWGSFTPCHTSNLTDAK